jgi:tRNA A-37 threonylcarbamoyl transferase component Bud32/preprotein translocase subunit SecE
VYSVSFSPNGKYIASGSLDKTIKLWLTPWEAERREEVNKILWRKRQNTIIITISVIAGIILVIILFSVYAKIRANLLRETLPDKIKEAISNSNYQEAWKLYSKYKSVGGEIQKLSPDELLVLYTKNNTTDKLLGEPLTKEYLLSFVKKFIVSKNYQYAYRFYEKYLRCGGKTEDLSKEEILNLYSGINALKKLPQENIPYHYLLFYSKKFADEGDYKNALLMLKDGKILEEFKQIQEYETFVDIYEKAGKLDDLLKIVVSPESYTFIAETLLNKKHYDLCEKLLYLKQQKYPKNIFTKDYELLFSTCKALDKVDQIDPNIVAEEYRYRIIDAMIQKGKLQEALSILKKKPKTDWSDKDYHYCFDIYMQLGVFDLAEEMFNTLKKRKSIKDIPELYYDFALFCEQLGKYKESAEIYKELIDEFVTYKDVLERYRDVKEKLEKKIYVPPVSTGQPIRAPGVTLTGEEELIDNTYQLIREIGRGGMSIVYEAEDIKLGKKVAIKKMKEEIRIIPREKERFLREAKTVAQLHHPNIVDIYRIIEEKGEIYLVFEFVSGKTVEQILNQSGKLSLKETLRIIFPVCDALSYAHSHKVVHRDLKPSNIMITDENYIKVMDFGIAREAKDTISRVSGEKDTSGTLTYIAPEQHLGKYSPESDIYSLGVTLYEMLTGEVPFRGADILTQKERMVYSQVSELLPDIPKEMEKIINKCLQADKEKRYKTVEELVKDLIVFKEIL